MSEGGTPDDADHADDLVVHVGYHKAGSTLVQQRLLRGEHGVHSPWPQSFYHRHVLLDRPDRGWARRVRAAFEPGIEEARSRGLVPALTCEALSGDMWRVGQANGYGNVHVADVLAEAFPGARVVIVHREQRAMITSLYKHSVRSHWRYGLAQFLDQVPLAAGGAPLLNLGYLEYSWLLEHYQARFGSDRVTALPFELLRDPAEWARRWAQVLGVTVDPRWFAERENPGMSAFVARRKRVANFMIPSCARPNETRTGRVVNSVAHQVDARLPDAIKMRSEERLRQEVDALVGERFAPDNRRLAGLVGEDWSGLGYPV